MTTEYEYAPDEAPDHIDLDPRSMTLDPEAIDLLEGNGWDTYGVHLVGADDDTWVAYAQELADDIGAVDVNAGWPSSHIDWCGAAVALSQDHAEVTYHGRSYYGREN